MKNIFLIVTCIVFASCDIGLVEKKGTVVDKMLTFDRYGYPMCFIIVKTDDGKLEKVIGSESYYKHELGDRVIIKAAK
jgi:hypothetical protein